MRLLSALAGAGTAAAAWHRRPLPARIRSTRSRGAATRPRVPAARVGAAIRARAGLRPDPSADERLGWSVVAAAPMVLLHPGIAVLTGAAAWLIRRWQQADRRRASEQRVTDELPDAVDLLALAVDAGLGPRLALDAVARSSRGVVAEAAGSVGREVERGATLSEALDGLITELGERVRPLVTALRWAEHHGTPLGPALELLARDLRLARRRHAEELVRRVPVKLIFPLVLCTLPAFALLTVVPLMAGSLGSLHL